MIDDTPGPQHARTLRPSVARVPALVLTGVLTLLASGAAAVYLDLRAQIDVSDVSGLVVATPRAGATTAPPDDPFAGDAMNILVMGTDLRDAENAALAGEADGMRSDTTMLVHVAGDRTWAEVVSIPRDSLVELPECALPGGGRSKPRTTMFNEAFSIGAGPEQDVDHAAACTIGAVQALTGVTVTHHLVVCMTGVIDVVDALGGVRMCLREPVDESPRYGDLHLPAGEQRLDGRQAIGFLRARHGTGMGLEVGSDLTRIARQQAFVQSAVRELLGKDLLGDVDELYRVARAVLGSLSADPQLADPVRLAAFASSLRGMDRSRIVFTEVPVTAAPSDRNRVVWTSAADEVWQRLASDTPPAALAPPVPTSDPAPTGAPTGGPAGGAAPGGEEGTPPGGPTPGAPAPGAPTPDQAPVVPPQDEVLAGVCA
ncbi:LCP family protein [Cellulomonas sp. B6]|uniref:LCP family protein n=1 Tax=Cellulomonas sp. B6 TaxID=1295626 RepID=UPI001CBF8ECF|nr:LCP family protein [Cellulomonas sp. B6]